MKVSLLDHMGSDLTVVNRARVSFDKKSSWEFPAGKGRVLCDRDARLIKYLAKHNHWLPFAHPHVTFHLAAPIFVARQLGKHQVGLVWSEISRRYVSDSPSVLYPGMHWRGVAEDKKQGSGGLLEGKIGARFKQDWCHHEYDDAIKKCLQVYETLLKVGVCPEQARMVLPQSMYTEGHWTGSLYAFARICKLRLKEDTQKETREIAGMIAEHMQILFPVSWGELVDV